jgi:hypothetical protein
VGSTVLKGEKAMDELAKVILEYESDTFSAIGSALTPADVQAMATVLFSRFCKVVAESGTFRCDGVVLSDILDDMRPEEDGEDWITFMETNGR